MRESAFSESKLDLMKCVFLVALERFGAFNAFGASGSECLSARGCEAASGPLLPPPRDANTRECHRTGGDASVSNSCGFLSLRVLDFTHRCRVV